MKNNQEDAYMCPSFSCYSADKLADIVAKVAMDDEENEHDEDFEFNLIREDEEVVVYDGQILSMFPVFNGDLKEGFDSESLGIPVNNILIDDREEKEERSDRNQLPLSSSSEGNELESVPPGTYSIWRPKAAAVLCKKSKSTGSTSWSWKLSDILRRSNSDGKDNYVFLTPKHRGHDHQKPQKIIESSKVQKVAGTKPVSGGGGAPGSPSPHEVLYTWNRAMNAEKRKKSYLPYRQGLVGFFTNVNGFSRSFPHF
ncbi:uncharacterized protein LOC142550311 [Primulina tabacum]|uniref:uncharacterized protein LOC142550311 n=1 Tax=Primulina tabacum TaxID=48773 RepID=UPI003F5A2863